MPLRAAIGASIAVIVLLGATLCLLAKPAACGQCAGACNPVQGIYCASGCGCLVTSSGGWGRCV